MDETNREYVGLTYLFGGIAFVMWVSGLVYIVEKDSLSWQLTAAGVLFTVLAFYHALRAGQYR